MGCNRWGRLLAEKDPLLLATILRFAMGGYEDHHELFKALVGVDPAKALQVLRDEDGGQQVRTVPMPASLPTLATIPEGTRIVHDIWLPESVDAFHITTLIPGLEDHVATPVSGPRRRMVPRDEENPFKRAAHALPLSVTKSTKAPKSEPLDEPTPAGPKPPMTWTQLSSARDGIIRIMESHVRHARVVETSRPRDPNLATLYDAAVRISGKGSVGLRSSGFPTDMDRVAAAFVRDVQNHVDRCEHDLDLLEAHGAHEYPNPWPEFLAPLEMESLAPGKQSSLIRVAEWCDKCGLSEPAPVAAVVATLPWSFPSDPKAAGYFGSKYSKSAVREVWKKALANYRKHKSVAGIVEATEGTPE